MENSFVRKHKLVLASLAIAMFASFTPAEAHAFSLKRLLNPFNAKVSSVLNPFHIVYKVNRLVGSNPVAFIPGDALLPSERRWVRDPKTNDWTKYSWELEDQYVPAPLPPIDFDPTRPLTPVPPAPVVVVPPCQRGGPGITPC